ncbi:hypothetical protein DVH24_013165 [Malus domestica]|uniref:DUF7806 domain-containing protein n=1 Tax=Malus domestica TaxID=3750 RepID=A0A498IL46_MALDO|nr:hypothetical protein DVH24_013165 [Malus domestica]
MSTTEALYSKLYDKYSKIKTKKWSELEDIGKDQEGKFKHYVSGIYFSVRICFNILRRSIFNICEMKMRGCARKSTKAEQCTGYQNRLLEENRKNEKLSEEVERLRKLQQEGNFSRSKGSNTDNGLCTPASGQVSGAAGNLSKRRRTSKRRKNSQSEAEDLVMPSSVALVTVQEPQWCRTIERPGCAKPIGQVNCVFQVLVEYMVDLKFSTVSQAEEICISAVHQSSGYAFNLTWMNRAAGSEVELLYHTASLGTLEREAPEWMKDDIVLSTNMCPIFFERLSRVVKLHS